MTQKIHPTAVIEEGATLGRDVEIGPYAIVGAHVKLDDGCKLHPHAVVMGHTTLGARCIVWPGAVIGGDSQDLKFKGEITFVEIGAGTTLRECVTVNGGTGEGTKTVIGEKCHIMAYSHVAHNCVVGNGVIIANCGTLAGHVELGDHVTIGGLTAVHQFVRIGTMAIIGGCSKVTQDIPPFMMADGHPAEVRTINKVRLERQGVPDNVQQEIRKAYKILFRDGLTTSNAIAKIEKEVSHSPQLDVLVNFIKTSTRGVGK